MSCSTIHQRLLSLVTATCLSFGASAAIEEQGQLPLDELRTFADVYNQIRIGYVEDIDDSTLLEYAIQGMLMGLDPHSVYMTKEAFEGLQEATSGEFTGLGLEVGMEDGYVKIISPIDGSPAAEAGLQSGDVILKLGTVPVKGMSLSDAIDSMRGPAGSEIKLTVGRSGESQPFEVTLLRDVIKVASVRQRWLEPGYGYIRIAQFQSATGKDVTGALEKLMNKQKLKGLVLDLRNNPGGVLRASVDVAGLFMDGGKVVYTEGRLPNSDMEFNAQPEDATAGIPIVVLINSGSASASEIVAGALQDHGRAVIMGTRSFGKGSVQTVLPISDSRAVKLTTALYFTPNGRSIQAEGIEPDIEVERAKVTAYDNSRRVTEADLTGHLNNANGEDQSKSKKPASRLLSRDNQLYEALTLLKGINILGLRDDKTANIEQDARGES
ncbi:S41 family peptidase [Halieaceae bacterium IMCC8485]|jgi:carboxyl-terminal processing protease|uniref:S41 family peptidase n=1 Tax=Candidatus Seongchinamella marina TaxID=2518990 RepID=A0ABT3SX37_9GAMM|nr:S41 family peptidase [Candidatus Seongchinamella marina]MCX2973829.1 S41 family peptidase [Candidatus Seongchinamella marina]